MEQQTEQQGSRHVEDSECDAPVLAGSLRRIFLIAWLTQSPDFRVCKPTGLGGAIHYKWVIYGALQTAVGFTNPASSAVRILCRDRHGIVLHE